MDIEAGFIGIGRMGLPMASNLIDAGIKLTVWNRTAAKAEPLAAKGARVAATMADAASPSGIVLSILADDSAVESVVTGANGIAARLAPGGIHVSMSTISPETSRRLADYHRERGSIYVTAPVFGRPEVAAARRLVIATSGPEDAKRRVKPLLEATSRAIYDFGDDVEAANVVKLCSNFMLVAAMEAMGEAYALAEKCGVNPAQVAKMLGEAVFPCVGYQQYGQMIANREHGSSGFSLPLGFKDVELVLKTARAARTPMPTASLVYNRMLESLAKGRANLEWSVFTLGILESAGIKV